MSQKLMFEEAKPSRTERVDFWNLIAHERGMPDGWKWFRLEVLEHRLPGEPSAVTITGAVCTAVHKSGKNKGCTNWSKKDSTTQRTLLVADGEYDARRKRWETETGVCSNCFGDGDDRLERNGVCRRCSGSGRRHGTAP
jgi:hypothetical protein